MTDDETDAPQRRPSLLSSLFSSKSSPPDTDEELRERMRTLDATERKWGFVATAVVAAAALQGTISYNTSDKYLKGRPNCPATYKLVGKYCEGVIHHKTGLWQVVLLGVLALVLLYSVWSSRRTLAVFMSVFAGLAAATSSALGLLIMFYGGWLLLRSWRLQRYGATDGKTVRKIAIERSAARKVARRSPAAADPGAPKTPMPSKRYTPKAKPRKR